MISLSIPDLARIINGKIICESDKLLEGVCLNADFIISRNAYFCINSSKYDATNGGLGFTNNEDSVYGLGGTQDGHSYICKAISNGAVVIVVEHIEYCEKDSGVAYVLVNDSLQALKMLATYYAKLISAKTIAITGSTGKTTTCQTLCDALSKTKKIMRFHRVRNSVLAMCIEILNNLDEGTDCIIAEMQVDGFGQIDGFCSVLQPDISIITNVYLSHYARFHTLSNIFNEKLAVYRNLKKDGHLIINGDNEMLREWSIRQSNKRIISIGFKQKYDVSLIRRSFSSNYRLPTLDVQTQYNLLEGITLASPGIGLIYASLFTVAVEEILGFSCIEIVESLRKCRSPIGRFSCFKGIHNSSVIVDSYNANYLSMKQGISFIANCTHKKKILILGSMLELAEKTESEHRNIGKFINCSDFDFDNLIIITMGEAAMYIASEIHNIPHKNIYCTFTYEDIVELLSSLVIDSDTIILIKGSGGMRMELIAPYLLSNRIF